MNIWLEAIRNRVRFAYKGSISVEDLFSLELSDLDILYQNLSKQMRDLSCGSLLDTESNEKFAEVELKQALVKGVFDIKQEEARALKEKIANLEERQKIMRVINQKEDAELANLSIEELKDKLNELE